MTNPNAPQADDIQAQNVREYFDAYAAEYEKESFPIIDAAKDFLRAVAWPGMKLLDVGCGPGNVTGELSDSVHVSGFDASHPMIEIARRRRPAGTWIVHGLQEPWPMTLNGPFELILANGVFTFVRDLAASLRILVPRMGPRARLYFTVEETMNGSSSDLGFVKRKTLDIFLRSQKEVLRDLSEVGLRTVYYRRDLGWRSKALHSSFECGYWLAEKSVG